MKILFLFQFLTASRIVMILIFISVSVQVTGSDVSERTFSRTVELLISKIDSNEYTNIHGVAVWKDGEIIGEKYWDSWNGDRPHMLQSATKSIASLLIGIAIHEGYIPDEKQKVLGFFPEYNDTGYMDVHKRALTIEDLLTMRTGMDWVEYPYYESHLARMNSNRNEWSRFVLDIPMKEAPGRNYSYNSGGTVLLAGVIREAANMPVQDFARRYLFDPLGVSTAKWWFTDRQGLPHTGGGLRMSARDMLKIGRLVLQCGSWNGKQILDCDYVNKLFSNYLSESLTNITGYTRGYSLLWHVFPVNPDINVMNSDKNFIAAWGAHGQWIMVFPAYNMVAVFIAGTRDFREETQFVRMVYDDLLRYYE
jgi:CubicO group peptidase (beta-lactamase class C family)